MPNTPTANQKKAIETVQGPVLITAGPGTGKTYTIVERILYLIKNKFALPNEILVITFTQKAAKELLTRVSNRFREEGLNKINLEEMYISTFHSFCERLISENKEKCPWLSKNYIHLEEFEQVQFISRYIKEVKKDRFYDVESFCDIEGSRKVIESYLLDTDFNYKKGYSIKKHQAAKAVCFLCDKLIEELIDPEILIMSKDPQISTTGKMLKKYQELLAESDCSVFSVLLQSAYKMLSDEEPDGELRNKFKYIMVDEYQDTNHIQERLVNLLGGIKKNICVVGDDDQSLYRFRGATVENILTFENRYSAYGCKKIELDENFRSNDKIVSFYTKWIKNPQDFSWGNCRLNKKLSTKKTALTDTVVRIKGSGEEQWKKSICDFIKNLKNSNKITDYNQVVFLCKSVKNQRAKALQQYLTANGIPVYSPRSEMFFDRVEIKLAIGCLLLMFPNTKDLVTKSKSEYALYCSAAFSEAKNTVSKNTELKSFIENVENNLDCTYTIKEVLYRLFAFEPFTTYVDVNIDDDLNVVRPSRNLSILINKCSMYERLQPYKSKRNLHNDAFYFFRGFLNYQFEDGIPEYEDEKEYAPKGYMSFMTFHQSKGLEFPVVIVDSLNRFADKKYNLSFVDTVINTQRPNSFEPNEDTDYFDFWREYYTAFSRAQNLLVLTCCKEANRIFNKVWDSIPDAGKFVPDLSKLSFDTVKSAEFSDSYAFTADILPYEACPKKYKFSRLLGFESTREDTAGTLFGSLVHQTVQDIHLEAMKNEPVTADKIDKWLKENSRSLEKAKKVKLDPIIDTARKNVLNYYNYLNVKYSDKHRWNSIKDAEMKVSVPMDNFIINGTIDMVRDYPTYYTIFDFKTGKKDKADLENYHRQLRVYAYLLGSVTEEKEVSMQLFFTGEEEKPTDTLKYDKEKNNIKKEIEKFTEIVNKIINHEFSKECTDINICKECDFRFLCKKSAD